ncbi:MAG: carboxypeptidase regulatory-like domain-containing protein [Vicinamibacterales bacterium]
MKLGRHAVRKVAFPFTLAAILAVSGSGFGDARTLARTQSWDGVQDQGQGQRQQPARDPTRAQAQPTGTATLSGHVIDYESGRPVKRARVALSSQALPGGRAAATDSLGAYSFTDLPAGQYTVNVTKTGYVAVSYGQRRPLRTGKPLNIRDGEQVKGIDFRLPKGSVISGHVYDEDGEPLLGVQVQALRYQSVQGQQRLLPAGAGGTDDRGYYRIFALQPGVYYVNANARMSEIRFMLQARGAGRGGRAGLETMQPDPENTPRGYAPTYYPGVTSLAQAGLVRLELTQEVSNIDIGLQLVPTARVSGIVMNSDGSAAANALVTLLADDGRNMVGGMSYSGRVQDDGTYAIENVPPGRYLAVARGGGARGGRQGGGGQLFARQSVTVAGQDVTGLVLALAPGASLRGSVSFESAESPTPAALNQIAISANPISPLPMDAPSTTRVSADGTFVLENIASGVRVLQVSGIPRPWAPKAIYLNGRDVSDTPVEFESGQRLTGVSIVFTDRATEVTGTVPAGDDKLLLDYMVVAFSANPAHWVPQSRRIQMVRPDAEGKYRVRGLPPGEYFFVAIDDAEQGEWYDAAFLDEIRAGAVKVSLVEGETKSQDLKLLEWQ